MEQGAWSREDFENENTLLRAPCSSLRLPQSLCRLPTFSLAGRGGESNGEVRGARSEERGGKT